MAETWQGVDAESCGAPVAPHDGSAAATFVYDEAAGTLTLNGVGAYIGLAKVVNGGEVSNGATVPASITYDVTSITSTSMTLGVDIGGGYWQFVLAADSSVAPPEAPAPEGSWDFDQDGNADALTDGLLLLRYAFGLTGDALVASAIAEASPLTPEQVQDNVHASTTSFADIDANGTVDALTDGLLLLRYLFGLTGDALLASAVAEDATRTSADDIEAYILSLYP